MRTAHGSYRITLALLSALMSSCAGSSIRPTLSPSKPRSEALLVLPGFGYGRSGEKVFQTVSSAAAAQGIDVFVPKYMARGGIAAGRENLQRFIREQRLDRYERLHVFAFIAGAWTFNPLAETAGLPNLSTVIYDRSPYQERAPRIAVESLPVLSWIRYGSPIFDIARTAYPPIAAPQAKIALVVETTPTGFVERHRKKAMEYGPLRFECGAFSQRFDDCLFLPFNHHEMYTHFASIWPEVVAFIRTGRFSNEADRIPPGQ